MFGKHQDVGIAPFVPRETSIPFSSEERQKVADLASRYVDGLPANSGSIFRLNYLLTQGAADLNGIVQVLSSDVSLSAQVVRLANRDTAGEQSPYRLDECTVLLGMSRLGSIVLTTALAPTDYETATALHALSQHCLLTSRFGERIAQACGYPEPYKAHIAGLLHDLGLIPVCLDRTRENDASLSQIDHCAVGGFLARSWKFPSFVTDVIEHHHDPVSARTDPLLAFVIATADEVSRLYGVGLKIEPSAHLASDCIATLDRYLSWLSARKRHALADVLQSEFLAWAKAPVGFEPVKGVMEGNWGLWQSAL